MNEFMDSPNTSFHPSQDEPSTDGVDIRFPGDWKYEEAVSKVETIITRLEMGELELAEVFDEFAIAVEYLRQCEAYLAQRQQQMDLLIETLADETEGF